MENDQHIIICVGRQLGSGGHDIARMLAMDFHAKYYDRELLNLAAKESGFSEKVFEQNDEQKGFFKSLFSVQTPHLSGGMYRSTISQESLFLFQCEAIQKAASEGSCVFVGRCADYVLRDMENVVNIFVTANLEERIQRAMERHQCDHDTAQKMIEHGENNRASYYNYYTGKRWGHAAGYDLCVNTSLLGIDKTVEYVAEFIRQRFNIQDCKE